jgi:hypothetical protein
MAWRYTNFIEPANLVIWSANRFSRRLLALGGAAAAPG